MLTEPVPGVLRFEDSCVVYAIRCPDDPAAVVLVDLGTGDVLDELQHAGVRSVRWILHTHHHRDQCQGDARAVSSGIPIAVPATERHLFERVEEFWENRQILHLYDVRNDYSTLTASVPVAADLVDMDVFDAGGMRFEVLPTPGHTRGSISLLTEVGERRVVFSGDLVQAGGTVPTLYDLQYGYATYEGVDLSRASIRLLQRHAPDVLLPSHGAPIHDPKTTLDVAFARLGRWWDYNSGFGRHSPASVVFPEFREITPRILECTTSLAQFYVLLSDTGAAALIDYGHMGPAASGFISHQRRGERTRFIPHGLDELRERGLREVEVAIPTHMHDDHVIGMPWLRRTFDTQVWAFDGLREVLEHPGRYLLGCSNAEAVSVDRTMAHGERVRWQEFEIDVVHAPGHTEYACTLVVEDAGRRVAFTGDNYFRIPGLQRDDLYHNVIFRNELEADSHLRALDHLLPLHPDVIAPGHMGSFPITAEQLGRHRQRLQEQIAIWSELIDGPVDYGVNPRWISLVPFTSTAGPGTSFPVELRVRNYGAAAHPVSASLALPPGWTAAPIRAEGTVAAGETASLHYTVSVPGSARQGIRQAITADVTIGGRRRGQIAEAVVDVVSPTT